MESVPGHGDMTRERPRNTEAEKSVLGEMLHSQTAVDEAAAVLQGRDFYHPAHETIFETILELRDKGTAADPITLSSALTKSGQLHRCGGTAYPYELAQSTIPGSVTYHAEIVHEQALLRRLIETGNRITQLGYNSEGDAEDLINLAQADLQAINDQRAGEDYEPLADLIPPALDAMEEAANSDGELLGIPTGFTDLDSLTRGFRPGQMIVIAGRPAMGKTTVSLDVARTAAIKNHIPCAFFSLEMSKAELTTKVISAESKVPLHHLTSGNLNNTQWTEVAKVIPVLSDAPLYVDDSPNLSMMDIRAKARRMKEQLGIRLIVIDYMQLMTGGASRRPESRQQEVAQMSRQVKLLAKELEIPVIVLSQLNRGPEQRQDKKPLVSDLRESGAVEQDADMVILVHREDAYERESPRAGEADLIVGKNRSGPTATITVAAQLYRSRFVDMANG